MRRAAPTAIAAAAGAVYVIVSPPSLDLAAHLLRAKLFSTQGFGVWNNWWYAGHHILGYSVLFPPAAAAITPQLAGALAAVGTAALFEPLAREHFGEDAWVGAAWFGLGTASNLFTGRLTFAFGLLPAVASLLALQRGRPWLAAALAILTALASPVAALFLALAGVACVISRRLEGFGIAVGALATIIVLAIAFPEGGSEPFALRTLWPVVVVSAVAAVGVGSSERTLRIGAALYGAATLAAYFLTTPVGSNAARLGTLVAGPLAALAWWRRRTALLVVVAAPLLWLQWEAAVRDVSTSSSDRSTTASYYAPLNRFLARQSGPPFRIEIPFTKFHWEAYEVAPYFPLARGWERQLDIKYNHLFYGGALTAKTYEAWLHRTAIRFVALADAPLDYSAHAEARLITSGLPYLREVFRSRHWSVYAVQNSTPIAEGPATLKALGPSSLTLIVRRPGSVLIHLHFTPYWAITRGSGCVQRIGDLTRIAARHSGPLHLAISFSLSRIDAHSPRCR